MITSRARHRAPLTIAAITLLAVGATGCFQNPIEAAIQGAVNDTVENVVEDATGADIDVDLDGGGASIPDGFPSDLPLSAGDPFSALAINGTYTLTYTSTKDAAEALVAEYRNGGWSVISEADYGELKVYIFDNGEWQVSISSVEENGEIVLSYTAGPSNA